MPRTTSVGANSRYPSGASRSKMRTRRRCHPAMPSAVGVAVPTKRSPYGLRPREDRGVPRLRLLDCGLHVTRAAVGTSLGEHVGNDELGLRLRCLGAWLGRPAGPLA